jgi:hypothetical protein
MAELQQLAPRQLKYPILKADYGFLTFKGLFAASEKSVTREAFTALNFQEAIMIRGDITKRFWNSALRLVMAMVD